MKVDRDNEEIKWSIEMEKVKKEEKKQVEVMV